MATPAGNLRRHPAQAHAGSCQFIDSILRWSHVDPSSNLRVSNSLSRNKFFLSPSDRKGIVPDGGDCVSESIGHGWGCHAIKESGEKTKSPPSRTVISSLCSPPASAASSGLPSPPFSPADILDSVIDLHIRATAATFPDPAQRPARKDYQVILNVISPTKGGQFRAPQDNPGSGECGRARSSQARLSLRERCMDKNTAVGRDKPISIVTSGREWNGGFQPSLASVPSMHPGSGSVTSQAPNANVPYSLAALINQDSTSCFSWNPSPIMVPTGATRSGSASGSNSHPNSGPGSTSSLATLGSCPTSGAPSLASTSSPMSSSACQPASSSAPAPKPSSTPTSASEPTPAKVSALATSFAWTPPTSSTSTSSPSPIATGTRTGVSVPQRNPKHPGGSSRSSTHKLTLYSALPSISGRSKVTLEQSSVTPPCSGFPSRSSGSLAGRLLGTSSGSCVHGRTNAAQGPRRPKRLRSSSPCPPQIRSGGGREAVRQQVGDSPILPDCDRGRSSSQSDITAGVNSVESYGQGDLSVSDELTKSQVGPKKPGLPGNLARSLKTDWKGRALDLTSDPHRNLLHPSELAVAATLRLTCATYLSSKRRIFLRRAELLRAGRPFRKTDAQQACRIDVNKASKLWAAFDRVGWFEEEGGGLGDFGQD